MEINREIGDELRKRPTEINIYIFFNLRKRENNRKMVDEATL